MDKVAKRWFAKELRHRQTDTEKKLWQLLRSRSLAGYKFRRQQPIDRFIVDFCCFKKRLVIELDGSQHLEQVDYDRARTDYLNSQGFRVIRFWDNQVFKETDAVLTTILDALEAFPHPSPASTCGACGLHGRLWNAGPLPRWEREYEG